MEGRSKPPNAFSLVWQTVCPIQPIIGIQIADIIAFVVFRNKMSYAKPRFSRLAFILDRYKKIHLE